MIRAPKDGHLLGMGTITRDISDLHQVREALEESNRQLQEANDEIHDLYRTATDLSQRLAQERDRLKEAQALAHIGSWELDHEGQTVIWSEEVYRLFEVDPGTFQPTYDRYLERVYPEDREAVDRSFRTAIDERAPWSVEHRLALANGHLRHVHVRGQTIRDQDGTPLRTSGTVQDIADRILAESSMRQAAAVVEVIGEAVVVYDAQGLVQTANPAFTRITGYTLEEVRGRSSEMWQSYRHDEEFYQQLWAELQAQGRWSGEIWNRRKDGEVYPVWKNLTTIRDSNGTPVNYVSTFSDISTAKETEKRLTHLANHDALTGVANRNLFTTELDIALRYAQRHGRHTALLALDLDRFKQVNDTFGHHTGDELLQEVARRLTRCVRDSDTVARLGGDEFAIICTDLAQPRDAAVVARKVIRALEQPVVLSDRTITTYASIGISLYPQDAQNSADLLRAADIAMYQAKTAGDGDFCYYNKVFNQ